MGLARSLPNFIWKALNKMYLDLPAYFFVLFCFCFCLFVWCFLFVRFVCFCFLLCFFCFLFLFLFCFALFCFVCFFVFLLRVWYRYIDDTNVKMNKNKIKNSRTNSIAKTHTSNSRTIRKKTVNSHFWILFKRQKELCSVFCVNGWQLAKMKRVFLTCPFHEIYRDEAVGLKSCKYT